jgi:hypothetical protein
VAHADGQGRFEGISDRRDTIGDDWKALRFAYRAERKG